MIKFTTVRVICMDGFPSGQRGQTVNLLQIASVVRIHLHPFARCDERVRKNVKQASWKYAYKVLVMHSCIGGHAVNEETEFPNVHAIRK